MSIEVRDLTKFYYKHQALNNVSFQIEEGEIVGVLGQMVRKIDINENFNNSNQT